MEGSALDRLWQRIHSLALPLIAYWVTVRERQICLSSPTGKSNGCKVPPKGNQRRAFRLDQVIYSLTDGVLPLNSNSTEKSDGGDTFDGSLRAKSSFSPDLWSSVYHHHASWWGISTREIDNMMKGKRNKDMEQEHKTNDDMSVRELTH